MRRGSRGDGRRRGFCGEGCNCQHFLVLPDPRSHSSSSPSRPRDEAGFRGDEVRWRRDRSLARPEQHADRVFQLTCVVCTGPKRARRGRAEGEARRACGRDEAKSRRGFRERLRRGWKCCISCQYSIGELLNWRTWTRESRGTVCSRKTTRLRRAQRQTLYIRHAERNTTTMQCEYVTSDKSI